MATWIQREVGRLEREDGEFFYARRIRTKQVYFLLFCWRLMSKTLHLYLAYEEILNASVSLLSNHHLHLLFFPMVNLIPTLPLPVIHFFPFSPHSNWSSYGAELLRPSLMLDGEHEANHLALHHIARMQQAGVPTMLSSGRQIKGGEPATRGLAQPHLRQQRQQEGQCTRCGSSRECNRVSSWMEYK